MDEKKDETAGKCGCGIHCGCCACRAIKGLILLLIGGAIGYGIGRGCRSRLCPFQSPAASAPSASAPAAQASSNAK